MPARGSHGWTLERSAEVAADAVRLVLAGASPDEAAAELGVHSRTVRRGLKLWRDQRGITARGLREMQIAARMARREERRAG